MSLNSLWVSWFSFFLFFFLTGRCSSVGFKIPGRLCLLMVYAYALNRNSSRVPRLFLYGRRFINGSTVLLIVKPFLHNPSDRHTSPRTDVVIFFLLGSARTA